VLAALVGWSFLLAWLSGAFSYDRDVLLKPVVPFVAIQMAAGALYLLVLWLLRKQVSSPSSIMAVFAAGLVMRLSQIAATPILETDQYRYLWDGAVSAHGLNPYAYAPERVRSRPDDLPDAMRQLAAQSGPILERINHPSLRTIYPPTAQAVFAVAHWLDPFSLRGLRWTWLGLDMAIVGMLALLLRRMGSSTFAFSLGIYWLNPLLIKEVFNSGHMELVLVATVVAALLAAVRQRAVLSMFLLGLAAGAKIWPMLLLPLFVRSAARTWSIRALGVGVFAGIVGILAWPVLMGTLDGTSGFTAYAQRWQMNDSVYVILYEALRRISPSYGHLASRIIIALGLLLIVVVRLRRYRPSEQWLIDSVLAVAAALFLLSPTQFPWYYLWLLPLLSMRPVWSLLGLTVTLPIYYLRFPLTALGHANWFDYGLVWLEFVPIWLLLALELRRSKPQPIDTPSPDPPQAVPQARIAVVIPALNEQDAIGPVLSAIPGWVSQVVVADNGSTDATAAVAAKWGAMVVREPRRGYGAACLAGIAALDRPDIVVFLDGDCSDHPHEMSRLVGPIVRKEADMVIGSRVLGRAEAGALTPQQRLGNALACHLIRLLHGVRYTDLGPFRAIRYSSLRRLSMDDRDYGWTVQMQLRAAQLGLRVMEVPVSYRRRIGRSKISGTIRGTVAAGSKILYTIGRELARSRRRGGHRKLIVFARYPQPGCTKTRLIPALGPEGAAKLQHEMTAHTLSTAAAFRRRGRAEVEVRFAGGASQSMRARYGRAFPFLPQGDGDLGKRLERAMRDGFDSGAGAVLMIGTDCPEITADLLVEAFEAMGRCDVVLGPATDGGYCLIGMRARFPELFRDIDWGTERVLAQTRAIAARLGLSVSLLRPLHDVDRPEDLPVWSEHHPKVAAQTPLISVIIPALNEETSIADAVRSARGHDVEVLVVDGGSTDNTAGVARQCGATVLHAPRGRASQMNAGAAVARGRILLFLHADSRLPAGFQQHVLRVLSAPDTAAGAFTLVIEPPDATMRLFAAVTNCRSRWLQLPYGDQALFMPRHLFESIGGFSDIPIMEDVTLVQRLRTLGQIRIANAAVRTSGRRWYRHGCWRMSLLNQLVLTAYALGVGTEKLHRWRESGSLATALTAPPRAPACSSTIGSCG